MSQMPPSPPPAAGSPPPTSGKAVTSLICSIVGFFTCPLVLHIVGIVLGNQAIGEIRQSDGRLGGDGLAKAGVILGWVGVAIGVLGFCIWLAALAMWLFTSEPVQASAPAM